MKKLCFVEMEGVLSAYGNYSPNDRRVRVFLEGLAEFCKKNKIEFFMVSGHHESYAKDKLARHKFHDFFDSKHFFSVDEKYISKKSEPDERLHREGLEKDPAFSDSYFKQVIIQEILAKKKVSPKDALLLGDDLWVDGYYTARFSKVDFALFEENLLDRGKPAQQISGLAYFNLDPASAERLLKKFPDIDLSALDKYVFESMKKALIGENFTDAVKKGLMKKMGKS